MRILKSFLHAAGMFKVGNIQRASPEVMYGEGKQGVQISQRKNPGGKKGFSLFFSVFKEWLSTWLTQPSIPNFHKKYILTCY